MDWVQEIDELHAFFMAWFNGSIESMARMEAVLDPGFTIVAPTGTLMNRAETIAAVGSGRGRNPDLSITTSDHVLISASDDQIVARYVEAHQLPDGGSRRVSTVVFAADGDTPHGVRWVSVHETWLDPDG